MFFRTNIEDHPPIFVRILNFSKYFVDWVFRAIPKLSCILPQEIGALSFPFFFVARSRSHGPPWLRRSPPPLPAGPERGAGRQPYCHTNATESSRLENQSYLLWRVPASKTSQCFHPPLLTGPIPLRLNKKENAGGGARNIAVG